ncbi:DUF5675 family protein [Serratia sp. Tan611]|uniref:DUF5675 family protein n=1 Tax=Serratia sp. Tan611 TaxID=2773264 RepID=UPI001933AD22|nr:DUF5675 family protein [Serratia sp. Tan611]CAE1143898.1 conserved protein of unknown function [Serratia sp. Tan611]
MAKHTIIITRTWQTDNSTISNYEITGSSIKGYFLERPGPDTQESYQRKRIPEGNYSIKWHYSSIPTVSPYNPVPLLFNATAPESRNILIHNGNFPRDTDGCLLIGSSRGVDFVGNSVKKLKELQNFITSKGISNFSLTIKSCYSGCTTSEGL